MNGPFNLILYEISIWAIPAVIAITFHEASHGYVARLFGDDTAWRLGRSRLKMASSTLMISAFLKFSAAHASAASGRGRWS